MGTSFYSKLNAKQKYIINCCFFVFAVNGLYGMILGSLLPLISDQYGLNNTVSGALLSAHQVGNLVAGFLAGILPLYLGRKKAVMFMSIFVVMGFGIMIITGNPVLLILGFLFTGLSRGSISNFNNAMVNEVSNSSPAALNILHSIFAIGAISAPFLVILSTKIGGESGWKIAAGVIMVLASISILLFSGMEIDTDIKAKGKVKISYGFLKNKYFWVSAGILFFYLCAEATINGWIVKYFVDEKIMSIQYAQMLAALLWLVILAGRLTVAFIGDKIAKEKILVVLSIGTVAFYFLLLSTRNLPMITVSIMGLGFFMAGIYPTTISNTGKFIKEYPMSMGVLLVLGGVGAIIMPIVTGALAEAFGIYAGMSAIVVAIILMMVCAFLNIILKPSK
ncbi:MAG TPA: MFS transporter [Epulopiscium sp.]|nr:MFS transporter [Candidatus Epulonipiscium sp.]